MDRTAIERDPTLRNSGTTRTTLSTDQSTAELSIIELNHRQVRSNTLNEIRRSRYYLIVFWLALLSNLLQIIAISIGIWLSRGEASVISLKVFIIWYGASLLAYLVPLIFQFKNPVPQDSFGRELEPENKTDRLMIRLREFLAFSSYVAFIGLAIVVSVHPKQADSAPILYFTALAIVLYNLFIFLLPFLLILTAILCLPLTLAVLARFSAPESRAASEETIKNVPEFTYQMDVKQYGEAVIEAEDAYCPICLATFREEPQIRVLKCRHSFHKKCADTWFRIQATCPLCVQPITEDHIVANMV